MEISRTGVSGYKRATRLLWKVSVLVCFFSQPVCVLNTKQYFIINLWNRSSQATFTGFYNILYSVGWSCIVFGAQIQIWDIFSTYNHSADKKAKVKKTVIIVEIWICLKTLLKMLFVIFSIAEPRPTFGPKEQCISGVCNYLLLTMCQVYHCKIGFPLILFKMSQGQTLWATGNLENLLHG